MSATLTQAGEQYADLWRAATYDSNMAIAVMRPGAAGKSFADTVSDLLGTSGRIQPTFSPALREVKRADLGRVQVGLAYSRRDVTILGAERLSAADAQLLHVVTARAGVRLYLVSEEPPEPQLTRWGQKHAKLISGEELRKEWGTRPSAGGRRNEWACHPAMRLETISNPACDVHESVTGCVLAWFPHALATARTSPRYVRARLYELSRSDGPDRWDVYAQARDTYYPALKAAEAADLTHSVISTAKIRDLSRDGTQLRTENGRIFQIPEGPSKVLAARRDVKVADGFAPESTLFHVRQTSVRRLLQHRPGDPQ
jgi:hypothetical protein